MTKTPSKKTSKKKKAPLTQESELPSHMAILPEPQVNVAQTTAEMPETFPLYRKEATSNPKLFRIVDVNGDWTHYFHEEKQLYLAAINHILKYGFAKDERFYNYLLSTTKEESKKLLETAGERGTRIHQAVRELIDGEKISYDKLYPNELTGRYEPLTMSEWKALLGFQNFCIEYQPELLTHEVSVYSEQYGYAGTIDFLGTILHKGKRVSVLLDWKSSSNIYPEYALQVAAYDKTLGKQSAFTGIVRLGTKHKSGFEIKLWNQEETAKNFATFMAVKSVYDFHFADWKFKNEEIPSSLEIKVPIIKPPKKEKNENSLQNPGS